MPWLPELDRFWSVLADEPPRLKIIDYYPVINQPITDNKAVQECLRYSEQGAREVGQKYVVTTFDLGVCIDTILKLFRLIPNDWVCFHAYS
jgi:hypothetical protein